ncbi:cbb3-type cytochrome oxidase assembly protein CcoS [Oceaniglobus trochenteri]|uniref:cbb3-type cytochrome oxidase assembly protein CcoS n=1 Tax=Oceaniglobus trochenteri TaxID=2763260 RepID=UPI001D000A0B|nr:cbb3-type cytochrome oxidase assembly protein CcoS [Oceaniglobus trochenteri]
MSILIVLIPVSLAMGAVGVAAFLWSLRADQYDDMSGDAERILYADDRPLAPKGRATNRKHKETDR